MKLNGSVLSIIILLGNVVGGVAVAAPSLCVPTEAVIFSCSTSASKVIALCMDGRNELITYRYGKSRQVEMSYSAKLGSENGFYGNHYFRPGVDYARISFSIAGYKYSVFRNYDVTETLNPKYGVVVSKNGDDEVQLECRSQVIDNMGKIIKYLKCDANGALGCP